jgi:hypothetical protein
MRSAVLLALALSATPVLAQDTNQQPPEKPVPKNEVRVQVPGCAYNRTFISGSAPKGEPVGAIKEGRRFKMSASKEVLADIKKQQPSMIEITGRIRRTDLEDLRGTSVGGGVRIGGGAPQAPTAPLTSSSGYYQVIIDVEAFRLLPETCPRLK